MSLYDKLHCGERRFQLVSFLSVFGSATCQDLEAASHPDLLMSLNFSRNAVAMERGLGHLADAERALEDCSSCLVRDGKQDYWHSASQDLTDGIEGVRLHCNHAAKSPCLVRTDW